MTLDSTMVSGEMADRRSFIAGMKVTNEERSCTENDAADWMPTVKEETKRWYNDAQKEQTEVNSETKEMELTKVKMGEAK